MNNQEFFYDLSSKIFDDFSRVLFELDVELTDNGDRWTGVCPIHPGADNPTAVSIRNGSWTCYTHHCEKIFKKSLIGFIRGVLSAKKGWSYGDIPISFPLTLKWIYSVLGIDNPQKSTYNKGFGVIAEKLFLTRKTNVNKLSRGEIRKRLRFPAKFLLERGFKPELLNSYDIGVCLEKGKDMAGRVVVPVYSDCGLYMVGCLGRSINPLCSSCNQYHYGPCPQYKSPKFEKWINSKGFYADSYLFNYWKAKEEIRKTHSVVLVEGPLDCLKLIQSGISNCVALFGNNISDEQVIALERFPLQEIIVMTDNDEPGIKGKEQIKEQCKHLGNVKILDYDGHDPGELKEGEIRKLL